MNIFKKIYNRFYMYKHNKIDVTDISKKTTKVRIIGDNCLFSSDVNLFNTDSHPIFDKTTGKLINCVNDMTIGNNCWLGKGCSILKGVTVPNGTIVGWRSVVSKSIDKEYCAVAGVPAKIVKENVSWQRKKTKEYVENQK